MAIIGILKEPEGENRVVALPEIAAQFVKMNFSVLVEQGAGTKAFASDEDYKQQGAEIADKGKVLASSDVILRINSLNKDEISKLKSGAVALAMFQPFFNAI